MPLTRWTRRLFGTLVGQGARPRPPRYRPRLEALEERALLSGGAHDPAVADPTAGTAAAAVVQDTGPQHGPDGPTDAQNGYPQPPSTGPTLDGTLGVQTTPVPVLPAPSAPPGPDVVPTTGPTPTAGTDPTAGTVLTTGPTTPVFSTTGASGVTTTVTPSSTPATSPTVSTSVALAPAPVIVAAAPRKAHVAARPHHRPAARPRHPVVKHPAVRHHA